MKYYWVYYKTQQLGIQGTLSETNDVTPMHPFLFIMNKNARIDGKEYSILCNWKEITEEEYKLIMPVYVKPEEVK